jgi:hypothetical protein
MKTSVIIFYAGALFVFDASWLEEFLLEFATLGILAHEIVYIVNKF